MIDPLNITNFNRSQSELEEFVIFSVLVAGKTAKTTAKNLEKFLSWNANPHQLSPLNYIIFVHDLYPRSLPNYLRECGTGCFNQKADTLYNLAIAVKNSQINLLTVEPKDLEEIKGIGPKTSRFFILHSRQNACVAVLDTHILKELAERQYKVPKATPSNPKVYRFIEELFLSIADKENKTAAKLDLEWWRKYSQKTP